MFCYVWQQYTARQNVTVAVRSCVVRTEQKRRGRRYVLLCLAAIHSQTERRSHSTVVISKDRTEEKRKTQYTARQNVAVALRWCAVRTGQKRRGRLYVLSCLAAIHSQTERRSRSTVVRSKDRTEEKRKAVCFVTLLPSQVCWLGGHTAVSPRASVRAQGPQPTRRVRYRLDHGAVSRGISYLRRSIERLLDGAFR
ncbi:hypothetical protein J6590_042147 [Homalodisca vitripennis]|nr:hypothetical protein J6590_042147 [Homalodisca vitripennis]